jgi:hypothetical protein
VKRLIAVGMVCFTLLAALWMMRYQYLNIALRINRFTGQAEEWQPGPTPHWQPIDP